MNKRGTVFCKSPKILDGISLWTHSFSSDFIFEKKITTDLGSQGLVVHPYTENNPAYYGVVFFDHSPEAFYEFISQASHNGFERILVVKVNQEKLIAREAWNLLKAGASDVILFKSPTQICERIIERLMRWQVVDNLLMSRKVQENVVGKSTCWTKTLREVIEIAHFSDNSFLLTGESGTGKECVARLIHELDSRPNKGDLTVVDCTTLDAELSGSELFGHEKGAFTGATNIRFGAFALADGGTLFLDEIGEIPPELQMKLLRVIQEKTYKRVGGNTWYKTQFRLICATNLNLNVCVKEGNFREDLYYRIANWACELPPLRAREEDILILARHFLQKKMGINKEISLDPLLHEYFLKRSYPGNIRELKQVVTRISGKHLGMGPLTVGCIPEKDRECMFALDEKQPWNNYSFESAVRKAVFRGNNLKDIGRFAEDTAIRIVLHECRGNIKKAAKKLGVSERTVQLRKAAFRDKLQEASQHQSH